METAIDADKQAIRALIETWLSATGAGDVDAVLSLMTPDVVFLVAGQPPMEGRDAFGKALRTVLATHTIESSSEIDEVEVAGKVAWCRTRLKVTLIPRNGNTPMLRSGYTLSIFRRGEDGKWRLARDANMLAAAA